MRLLCLCHRHKSIYVRRSKIDNAVKTKKHQRNLTSIGDSELNEKVRSVSEVACSSFLSDLKIRRLNGRVSSLREQKTIRSIEA